MEGVALANGEQFRVFLDAQHLVEQLERFVLGLGLLKPLYFLIELQGADALPHRLHPLGRYSCLLPLVPAHLFVGHELGALLQQFGATLLQNLEVGGRRVIDGDAPVHNHVDPVGLLAKGRQARVSLDLVQLDLLDQRGEIVRLKVGVRLEETHRADVPLDSPYRFLVALARLAGQALYQLDLLLVRQLVKKVRSFNHFALDKVEVQVFDPIVPPFEKDLARGIIRKDLLEDHAFKRLLAVLPKLSPQLR